VLGKNSKKTLTVVAFFWLKENSFETVLYCFGLFFPVFLVLCQFHFSCADSFINIIIIINLFCHTSTPNCRHIACNGGSPEKYKVQPAGGLQSTEQ